MGWLFIEKYWSTSNAPDDITYSAFKKEVTKGNVKDITITGLDIKGSYIQPKDKKFKTYLPYEDKELPAFLEQHNVEVKATPSTQSPWLILILNGIPYLLIIGVHLLHPPSGAVWAVNQAFSFGRSRAKLLTENRVKVTFDDVAGVEEAKEELKEVVDFLKYPKKYQALGARIPKGVLLLGAPGTGEDTSGKSYCRRGRCPLLLYQRL